ncbi:MAG: DsbA family protein [Gammaproteobacteria bacterium]|nr:DsbA family protein [Gammaproteobacteria bacterium]
MLAVDFYFDLSCPWTCLASSRLQEAALRTGAQINWKPVLLEQVDPDAGATRWPADPRRAASARDHLAFWSNYCDVPIELPADWPADVSLAARGAVHAIQAGRAAAYVNRVFAAEFGAQQDIGDADLLCGIAAEANLAPGEFRAALENPATARALEHHADELLDRGGFSSATMVVGEQLFVGNESMPLVEFALGQASGKQFVMPGQHS